MAIPPARYTLGPGDGTLTVRTGKAGAAAKAGHNLVIEVTRWEATLELGDAAAAASRSRPTRARCACAPAAAACRSLGDEEKAGIAQTIDDDVLKGGTIAFRSSAVDAGATAGCASRASSTCSARRRPLAFDLDAGDDGRLTGSARFKQTDWGIKPYSALFGTLKVADEVEVVDRRRPLTT